MIDIKGHIKRRLTYHRQGTDKNIFIFSTARSGTTWLAEILATQGRFKLVNEPFNIRWPVKRETLGIDQWEDLLKPGNRPLLKSYVEMFINGKDKDVRFQRESPLSDLWRLHTNRIIFKILFAGDDFLNWFRDTFNGQIVFLLRHPIPVSLSREELPRLNSYLIPPFSDHFSQNQIGYAKSLLNAGNQFQLSVLDWCLQNSVRLKQVEPDWIVLSYEQLVLQPNIAVRHLADRLSLRSPDKMMNRIFIASKSTGKSSNESQQTLLDPDKLRFSRLTLVERWKSKISRETEAQAMETLKVFDIDYYEAGNFLPKEKYLLR